MAEAARLGLAALALTDHDGLYGVVRFAEAARALGLPTVFGAELTLGLPRRPARQRRPRGTAPGGAGPRPRRATPDSSRALGRGPAWPGGPRAEPRRHPGGAGGGRTSGHWLVLTGCRKGTVPAALVAAGPAAAGRELDRLVAAFGRQHVAVELWDHGDPLDTARNDALAALAVEPGHRAVATTNVHYATPAGRRLAAALAAVRARRPLDEIDGWLPAGRRPPACGRGPSRPGGSPGSPGVVERAAELGRPSPSTCGWWPRGCRPSRCPPATTR